MVSATPLTISVAMATYNGARFLAEQIQTIYDQSTPPSEIVISDDGSLDDTVALVTNLIPRAKERGIELKVMARRGTPGPAANFHYAVTHTAGDLIALADQDDIWLPGKLQALSAHFAEHPELLMAHSDADLVDEAGHPLGLRVLQSLRITRAEKSALLAGKGIRALVRRNLVTGATSMIHRRLIELAGPIPDGWLHDEWWALVAASHGGLRLDSRVFQQYRQHADNQVGASKSGWQRLRERFLEPQESFRARHRIRHRGLQAYLDRSSSPATPEAEELLRGRLRHYAWQATLPASRVARVLPIAREALRGGYRRYRRGSFDALRDLLQPGSKNE